MPPPSPPTQSRRGWAACCPIPRRTARVVGVIVGGSLALGLLIGAVWALMAPEVKVVVQDGGAFLTQEQGALLIGVDGWFTVLAIVAGIATGVLAWWRFRHDIVGMVGGVALGGFLGSLVAWRLGVWLGPGATGSARELERRTAQSWRLRLDLAAKAALLVWPIAAVFVVFLLALIEPRRQAAGKHAGPPPSVASEDAGG